MRTIIDGLAFAKAVAHVSKTLIAGQRQAVRLAATGDGLRLDADGQYYSRADLDAETVEDGSAVVNGFWLSSVASVLPSEELNVETVDSKLRLDCRGIVMELPLIDDPAAEPNVPDLPEEWASIADDGSPARSAPSSTPPTRAPTIPCCPPSASADRTAPSNCRPPTGTWRPPPAPTAPPTWTRWSRAAWLKANAEGADRIGATGRMFAIAGPVYTDATPMVEGQAPALAAIWPSKDAPLTLTMDRAELLEAARRVKAVKFSGGETVTLALAVGDDSVTLGLDDAESGSAPARPSPPRCPAPWSTGMWRARAAACAWTRATSPTPAAPSTATV